jgi:hypothetical protein
VKAPRRSSVLDDEFDFEAGKQDFVEHPDHQLVLTDRETPHSSTRHRLYDRPSYGRRNPPFHLTTNALATEAIHDVAGRRAAGVECWRATPAENHP